MSLVFLLLSSNQSSQVNRENSESSERCEIWFLWVGLRYLLISHFSSLISYGRDVERREAACVVAMELIDVLGLEDNEE